ncbi:alpha/beta fold hydrolase [Corynebacterium hindlerae]|uniref:Alpha/beta fold hydrolase n=1 Tax=Corynebacterium hindlerae TaxID=699041 RepID=A0A7G5FDD6_9CORY|nr:alpha/beta fold hydrolase [Corynebacterium hindlerae]QMV84627.1 alpha/beta fold hydrolase [Corynebacterium hindlerae]
MPPRKSRLLWLPRRGTLPAPIDSDEPPVVVLHGTLSSPGNFQKLAEELQAGGRPVIGLEYGQRGTADLDVCTDEVVKFLSQFPLVDVIGHSLGGLIGLRATQQLDNIRVLMGLGAAYRGVPRTLTGRVVGWFGGPAFLQLQRGFEAEVPTGVEVVSVLSTADTVVPRYSSVLGEVIEIAGVHHAHLPNRTEVIIPALEAAILRSDR